MSKGGSALSKILLILEVSRKQDYIFSSIHLRDNAARSDIIRYVTSEEFFKQAAPEYYNSRENFVYAGGGHTILQFGDRATATRFAEQVTQKAMREYDGLELFFVVERLFRRFQYADHDYLAVFDGVVLLLRLGGRYLVSRQHGAELVRGAVRICACQ